jgi:hypothetical protein
MKREFPEHIDLLCKKGSLSLRVGW